MSAARHERLVNLFLAACELPAGQRKAYLDEACRDDPALRADVETLIEQDERPGEFGDAARLPSARELSRLAGDVGEMPESVGPYRLLRTIGSGGMGIVYLAEQRDPVERRVALKIIKLGMDTKAVLARFEAERQALAMMDHPNVARLFDAGATETGRPYFVMEYVPGTPITEYCDRQRLDIPQRLNLFMQVCEAVQHAHQKGIIHRDVKPSNVLVAVQESNLQAKVIDFGVAKAINQRLTERTIYTEQGQLIGTPEYMSPEQAEMTAENIDTRTDIYSLGVLLYELLTGVLPFDRAGLLAAGFAEIQRVIREQEPPRPSTRLSGLGNETTDSARRRRLDPRALLRELRGDLDWITMKALEKDRTRRYSTAAELAADVRRHLDNLPVMAGPPSAAYLAAKFVRRHRVGVVATAALGLTLVAGVIATTWQVVRATRAEATAVALAGQEANQRRIAEANAAKATAEAAKSQEIAGFIQGMLSGVDPRFAKGKDTELLRRILDDTSNRIETELAGQPEVEAAIRDLIGRTYRTLGEYALAEPHLAMALDTRHRVLGDDHPDTLSSINAMGSLLWLQGKPAEAEPYVQRALEGRRRVLGDDHPDTLSSLSDMGGLLWAQGKLDEAESFARLALEGHRRVLGDRHPETLTATDNMGTQLRERGKFAEAELYHREALEGYRRVLGDDHPDTLSSINNMGYVLQVQGKLAEAEPYFREAMERRRRVLGNSHPDTLQSIHNLAFLLQAQGKLGEAEVHASQSLEGYRRILGPDHPDTLTSSNTMGSLLQAQGKLAEAEPYYREALEGRRRVLGNDHPSVLAPINNLGTLLRDQGKLAEAEPYYREALAGCRRALGDEHPHTLGAINNLAVVLREQGKLAEAEPYHVEALEGRRRLLGDNHPDTLSSINNMGALLRDEGRLEEAVACHREAIEKARRVLPERHVFMGLYLFHYGLTLVKLARQEDAEAALIEAHQILAPTLGAGHQRTVKAVEALVALYDAWGKPEQAAEWRAKLPTKQDTVASD